MPQNQRKHPRPGLVLDVDRTTPPILFHHGEVPHGETSSGRSRVVYPAEPLPGVANPNASITHALENPLGDSPRFLHF
ncbi:MAG: hypothetical protein CM15mP49_03850 [Actinomycetota bacterium]|nr:MAG: hypothetical protein CM15mP49_03850 [Actinomycetota bacterium]